MSDTDNATEAASSILRVIEAMHAKNYTGGDRATYTNSGINGMVLVNGEDINSASVCRALEKENAKLREQAAIDKNFIEQYQSELGECNE